MKTERQSGFSLIEIALALLVISVGVLALFGLFASGLIASQRADHETQAAFFAQTVFNTIKVELKRDWDQDEFWLGNQWRGEDDERGSVVFTDTPRRVAYLDHRDERIWFNYHLHLSTPPNASLDNHKGLTLEVWPGEFMNPATTGMVFYTELYRMDRL